MKCPKCGDELEAIVHSAPGFGGVEGTRCPACGWVGEP